MKRCAVDNRAAMIIRWIERLKKSYRDGAIESALMDAECARAELETLRNDVWQKVKPSEHNSSHTMTRIFRYVSIAVIAIFVSVVPLAKDNVPVRAVSDEMKVLPLPVQAEVIREDKKPKAKAVSSSPTTTSASSSPKKTSRRSSSPSRRQAVIPRSSTVHHEPVKTVPYDKVFSLVQTGQRALKENSSVISVKK